MVNRELLVWIALISAYLLTRLAEIRTHRSNYDFLVFAGGEERAPRLMQAWNILGYLVLPAAGLEFYFMKPTLSSLAWQLSGWGMVSIGLALRIWSVRSLGRMWSLRCVYVSGFPTIKSGPYRVLKHPEYLSRVLEGVGLCLFVGVIWSGGIFLAASISILARIIQIESRQIRELAAV